MFHFFSHHFSYLLLALKIPFARRTDGRGRRGGGEMQSCRLGRIQAEGGIHQISGITTRINVI